MADVTVRFSGVRRLCIDAGPGAINMTLGVANAYLDRSPLIAVTASVATTAGPYAAISGWISMPSIDRSRRRHYARRQEHGGEGAERLSHEPGAALRTGAHALPSDVLRMTDVEDEAFSAGVQIARRHDLRISPTSRGMPTRIRQARRPVVILGLDLTRTPTRRASRHSSRNSARPSS